MGQALVDTASALANLILDDLVPYTLISSPFRYIGTMIPDVTIREVHNDEYIITQHPVETGTPIADHVFRAPYNLQIKCGFSNSTAAYPGYVQEIYDEFRAMADEHEPFEVSTGKRLYENMLVARLSVETDDTTENVLMLTVDLQEIIITDTDGTQSANGSQQFPQQTSPQAASGTQPATPAPAAPSFANTPTGVR